MTKPTPRTDKIALRLTGEAGLFCDDKSLSQYNDLVDESRQLERELAVANERLERLRGLAKAAMSEKFIPYRQRDKAYAELRAELGEE